MAIKKKIDYKEQYKSPKWQKLRLKILERDDWCCQKCLDKEAPLHVHHRRYIHDNKIWEYEAIDLVTLCDECHKEETLFMKNNMQLLVGIFKRYLFSSHINILNESLGYSIHKGHFHQDLLIEALGWIIENKLESNIIIPFLENCKDKGRKIRFLNEHAGVI